MVLWDGLRIGQFEKQQSLPHTCSVVCVHYLPGSFPLLYYEPSLCSGVCGWV